MFFWMIGDQSVSLKIVELNIYFFRFEYFSLLIEEDLRVYLWVCAVSFQGPLGPKSNFKGHHQTFCVKTKSEDPTEFSGVQSISSDHVSCAAPFH